MHKKTKYIFFISITFLLLFSLLSCDISKIISIDDCQYEIFKKEKIAKLKKYDGNSDTLEIPTEINYKKKRYVVEIIGNNAIEYRENLTFLSIPETVKRIDTYAISNCENLTTIKMPNNIEVIKQYAFAYNKNLTSITIPNGITKISEGTFISCQSLTSIVIPNTVTSIEKSAFQDCRKLTSIIMSENLATIGDSAFKNCDKLSAITIPNGITTIGDSTFEYCVKLISIDLPNSVTSIGQRAFFECDSLISVRIRKNVTHIGENAFANVNKCTIYCEQTSAPEEWDKRWSIYAKRILWEINDNNFIKKKDIEYLLDNKTSTTTILKYTGTNSICEIPSQIEHNNKTYTVTCIGEESFADNSYLTSVSIPNTITTIEKKAFENVANLLSIYIPNNVTSIENYAFLDCKNISIYCAEEEKPENWGDNWGYTVSYIYWGIYKRDFVSENGFEFILNRDTFTASLVRYIGTDAYIEIPSTIKINNNDYIVTSIFSNAFNNCNTIRSISLPNTISEIKTNAFFGCKNLLSVKIPKSVKYMERHAFFKNDNVKIYCEAETQDIYWDALWNESDAVVFWGINEEKLVVVDKIEYLLDLETSTAILNQSLNYNSETIKIPSAITHNNVDYKVVSIEENAFANSQNLINVKISNTITIIKGGAFKNCVELRNVTISDSVTTIESAAFYYCESLISIIIPSSVTYISADAFTSCDNLMIYCESKNQQNSWGSNWNGNRPTYWEINETNFVQEEKYDFVLNTTTSTAIITKYKGKESKIETPSLVTYNNKNYTVTEIGLYAFAKNTKIIDVKISDKVEKIGAFSFKECSNMKTLTMADSVKIIGSIAFYDCEKLETVKLSNNLTNISNQAFKYCTKLRKIVIPYRVTWVESDIFYGCTELTVYCEAESEPIGWNEHWKDIGYREYVKVVWGYKK